MTRTLHRTLTAATACLLVGCGGGGDGQNEAARPLEPLSGNAPASAAPDVVIQLRSSAALAELAARYRLAVVDQFGSRPIYRLRLPQGTNQSALIEQLRQEPAVRIAEPNAATEAPESRRVSVWAIGSDAGQYVAQWAPQAMRLGEAHTLTTGAGVRVAVLDTGADLAHPALAGRWARDASGTVLGRDFVDDDADASEVGGRADLGYGHGTHVAGLVALVAPGAALMPIRVLDSMGRGNAWVVAEALAWALDPDGDPASDDGAHVINLSLGSTEPTALLKAVTDLATCQFDDDDDDNQDDFADAGYDADRVRCRSGQTAAVIAAAGNGGNDVEFHYPAAEDVKGVLAVTANTAARTIAGFANWGGWVDAAAPGEAIVSTVPGGGYGTWSGTSMAAPLAAGTAALVLTTLPSGGDPTLPTLRQWLPEFLVKRLTDRSGGLCASSFKGIDAAAAVTDTQALDASCP